MTDSTLLDVSELRVGYRVGRGRAKAWVQAVDGVSLRVGAGEIMALVGESGCGKTSTAHAILRLIALQSGRVRVQGRDISGLTSRQLRPIRRGMQAVFQDPYESLDPRFTVYRTVEEPLVVHGQPRSGCRAQVIKALTSVGLDPPDLFLERYPHELSGGQRQRVAIAAAVVLRPELLIADEPVSMLDVSVKLGVLAVLAELRDGGTGILMVTHDLATAAAFADRMSVMYLGRIVEEGPTRQIIEDPRHPYTQALIRAIPRRRPSTDSGARIEVLAGEVPDPTHTPTGCRFHPRCPAATGACQVTDPALLAVPCGALGHRAACIRLEELQQLPAPTRDRQLPIGR